MGKGKGTFNSHEKNEHGLNLKQQKFADLYIESLNVTQSYLKAYTDVKDVKSASASGGRLLHHARVRVYIDKRLEELEYSRIADQKEVMEYLTSLMRGEEQEEVLKGVGEGIQQITNISVSAKDRIKAAELIGKRFALWTDKQEISATVTPVFIDDIEGEDDGG